MYKLNQDGTLSETAGVATGEPVDPRKRTSLTEAFSPTILRESIGAFADVTRKKKAEVQVRLGVGAWEIFGRDGFAALSDDDVEDKLGGKIGQDENGSDIAVDPLRDVVLTPSRIPSRPAQSSR